MALRNMANKSKAVVLMSGGMDSCVTAAIAAQEHEIAALHCSYGQLTEERERLAFQEIADHYKIRERLLIDLPHLGRLGGSALTDPTIPLREADLEATDVPASYVPFRNAHFLVAAVSWGEVIGASKAKELVFSGRFVGAEEALELGLIDQMVAPDHVYDEALAWAQRFIEHPVDVLAAAKAAVDKLVDRP